MFQIQGWQGQLVGEKGACDACPGRECRWGFSWKDKRADGLQFDTYAAAAKRQAALGLWPDTDIVEVTWTLQWKRDGEYLVYHEEGRDADYSPHLSAAIRFATLEEAKTVAARWGRDDLFKSTRHVKRARAKRPAVAWFVKSSAFGADYYWTGWDRAEGLNPWSKDVNLAMRFPSRENAATLAAGGLVVARIVRVVRK